MPNKNKYRNPPPDSYFNSFKSDDFFMFWKYWFSFNALFKTKKVPSVRFLFCKKHRPTIITYEKEKNIDEK